MWHKKGYKRLNRTAAHRKAMLRNIATSLIQRESVQTTIQKAKALRPVIEKLVTSAKKGTLPAKKAAYSYLMNKNAVDKLFGTLATRYASRAGGYTRVIRAGTRHGDAAQFAVIAFVDAQILPKKKKKKTTESEVETSGAQLAAP